MAVISPTPSTEPHAGVVTWTPLAPADTCTAIAPQGKVASTAAVAVTGTFGGATITLHGSLDGTNFFGLKDRTGAAVSFTAAGLAELSTAAVWIRPVITAGAASSVTVALALRG